MGNYVKPICRNCHFLSKEYREANTGRVLVFNLTQIDREKIAQTPDEDMFEPYSLNCHMGVWDEGVMGGVKKRGTMINLTPRGLSCFFFPYNPAMLFDAAKELQKRQDENMQLKVSNSYTRAGLWIAAGALAVNTLLEFLKQT